eukprot:CAMPEP_0115752128 /NCGR_PEP_ID=MMETSP0272-20121206/95627_1 /TAXON_ID=71861 /ORGANISM="Scrippsiella trochoidea, Strain CCMP3099" /LENGTH=639 /DNA_ID=CAMNT_0003197359 /DNA_START=33 /DNA_END=1949 /DNA_ORIENTATION=-
MSSQMMDSTLTAITSLSAPTVTFANDKPTEQGPKFSHAEACKGNGQPSAMGYKAEGQKSMRRWITVGGLTALSILVLAIDPLVFGRGKTMGGFLASLQSYSESGGFMAEIVLMCTLCTAALVLRGLSGSAPTSKDRAGSVSSRKAPPHSTSRGVAARGGRTAQGTAGVGQSARKGPGTVAIAAAAKCNQAIDAAAREGNFEKAGAALLEFERCGGQPDVMSYNLLLRCCAKMGDADGAERWFKRMEARGVRPTLCSFNTMLDACAKANRAEACEAWLKQIADRGLEANVISYATAIYARARRGDAVGAEDWLTRMIAAGVEPDSVSYNSVIHAYSVKGNVDGAERWLKEMRAHNMETSVATYTTLIDACAKSGDIVRAEKWLAAMLEEGLEPNVVTFSAMIDACAKAGNRPQAEFWHEKMTESGVQPNAHSYSAVINACAKAVSSDSAEAAERWLDRSEKAGIPSDVVMYSGVIDACGKAGDAERALRVFHRMRAHGLKPHIQAYAALARPFSYRGDWIKVEGIAQTMAADRVATNEYFLYAQLVAYAVSRPRQQDRAEQCFRKALAEGIPANDHVVGALARAVGRARCTELMDELCNGRGVPPPPQRRMGSGGSRSGGGTGARFDGDKRESRVGHSAV